MEAQSEVALPHVRLACDIGSIEVHQHAVTHPLGDAAVGPGAIPASPSRFRQVRIERFYPVFPRASRSGETPSCRSRRRRNNYPTVARS